MTNEEILHELGLTNGSDEMKARVVENVRTIVELRVIGVITELMTQEQAGVFAQLQEAGDNDAVWAWLKREIVGVDVSEVYEATLKDYIEQRKSDESQI